MVSRYGNSYIMRLSDYNILIEFLINFYIKVQLFN